MSTNVSSIKDKLFCGLQYLLPQHLLSRLGARLAESRIPWFKNFLIGIFIKKFQVDIDEACDQDLDAYSSFNDFFTRALKPNARPITDDANALTSPADGTISQCGDITQGQLIQAKGLSYLASDLIGDEAIALQFRHGKFITTYLSPRDYHRVHMPLSGTLLHSRYIPGKLFSVNTVTASLVPELFARNERLVCVFESQHGPFVLIMVGAMMVAGIESVWQGSYSPRKSLVCNHRDVHGNSSLRFDKGAEIGRFKFGSTVILLLSNQLRLEAKLEPGLNIQVGETVAMSLVDEVTDAS
ncbi:MAG: phosphatidylserine decarboxylase [Porticoccaceae bacterium]|nr:phosphatidylserine decarboxylase [Porticoccaceae bacterium]